MCCECCTDTDPLRLLPTDVALLMFSYLPADDVVRMQLVCRSWTHGLLAPSHIALWTLLLQRDVHDEVMVLHDALLGTHTHTAAKLLATRTPYDVYMMAATGCWRREVRLTLRTAVLGALCAPFVFAYYAPSLLVRGSKGLLEDVLLPAFGAAVDDVLAPLLVFAFETLPHCVQAHVLVPLYTNLVALCRTLYPVAEAAWRTAVRVFITIPQHVVRTYVLPACRLICNTVCDVFDNVCVRLPSYIYRRAVVPAAEWLADVLTRCVVAVCVTYPKNVFHHVLLPLWGVVQRCASALHTAVLTPMWRACLHVRDVLCRAASAVCTTFLNPALHFCVRCVRRAAALLATIPAHVRHACQACVNAVAEYIVHPVHVWVVLPALEALVRGAYAAADVALWGFDHVLLPLVELLGRVSRGAVRCVVEVLRFCFVTAPCTAADAFVMGVLTAKRYLYDPAAWALCSVARGVLFCIVASGRAARRYVCAPAAAVARVMWAGVVVGAGVAKKYLYDPFKAAVLCVGRCVFVSVPRAVYVHALRPAACGALWCTVTLARSGAAAVGCAATLARDCVVSPMHAALMSSWHCSVAGASWCAAAGTSAVHTLCAVCRAALVPCCCAAQDYVIRPVQTLAHDVSASVRRAGVLLRDDVVRPLHSEAQLCAAASSQHVARTFREARDACTTGWQAATRMFTGV